MATEEHPLITLLSSIRVDKFRYGPDKPLVVLRSHWPVERALKVLLRHSITCAVSVYGGPSRPGAAPGMPLVF